MMMLVGPIHDYIPQKVMLDPYMLISLYIEIN